MRVTSRKGAAPVKADRAAAAPKTKARPKSRAADAFSGRAPGPTVDLSGLLEAARAVRRSSAEVGREAVLTPREEARVRSAFSRLPKEVTAGLSALLAAHSGDGANVAHALLFKAVAARADALPQPQALAALRHFDRQLKALSPEAMLERATVLDLDPKTNSSPQNPQALWDRRGVVRARDGGDTAADNDGLVQRFTASCGPTALQMLLAEADPVLAFAINRDGRSRDATTGPVADFQRAVLEEYGGIAVGRAESALAARVHNAFAHLVRAGTVTTAQRDAAVSFLKGGPQAAGTADGLEACRKAYGFPSENDVARLRAALLPARDEGLGFDEFKAALVQHARAVLGAGFEQTRPPEGFARGQAGRHLDAVEAALKKGFDVPVGTCEPAHWMLLTAVRLDGGGREFLVSDPDGGKTAWVKEHDLVSGTALATQFHLPKPGERPYIDSFFLPVPPS